MTHHMQQTLKAAQSIYLTRVLSSWRYRIALQFVMEPHSDPEDEVEEVHLRLFWAKEKRYILQYANLHITLIILVQYFEVLL